MIDEINEYGRNEFCIQTQDDLINFIKNMKKNLQNDLLSSNSFNDIGKKMEIYIENYSSQGSLHQKHFSEQAYIKIKENYQKVNVQLFQYKWKNEIYFLLQISKADLEQEIFRLKQEDKCKDRALANVSHDLRTPLNIMLHIGKQQHDNSQEASVKKQLKILQTNGFQLQNLINDILDQTLLKENKIKIVPVESHTSTILEEISDMFDIQADCKKIQFLIHNELQQDQILITDRTRLKQILINLISNAMKFTSHGYVQLSVQEQYQDQLIVFNVSDTGSGMTQTVIDQLGQPFATFGNQANQNATGIGLGLNLSKQLLHYLGPCNNFDITSEVGKGSIFEFKIYKNLLNIHNQIQLIKQQSNEVIEESQSFDLEYLMRSYQFKKQSKNLQIDLRFILYLQQYFSVNQLQCLDDQMNDAPINILLVDDNPFNLMVLEQQLLKINSNFIITQAFDGKQAYDLFLAANNIHNINNYQIIFMDCDMPIINGFQASKMIKEKILEEHFANAIVIGFTALVDISVEKKAKKNLMDDIRAKPISFQELKKVITNSLKNL